MHFLFIAGVGKKSRNGKNQPPHDLQSQKNCIKINIYFLHINVNNKLQNYNICICSLLYALSTVSPILEKSQTIERGFLIGSSIAIGTK